MPRLSRLNRGAWYFRETWGHTMSAMQRLCGGSLVGVLWLAGALSFDNSNLCKAERILLPAVAAEAPVSTTTAADHPRLAELIELGVVKRAPARSWGSEQATGAPDTEGAGDISTAWASQTPDGQPEWLELTFEKTVKPVEVHVVETYNPGALFKITATSASGMEAVLWKGEDPTRPDVAERRGTSVVKVRAALETNRIRIHLASDKVPGWNEIDAVGIKDEDGTLQWAVSATASSEYAGGNGPGWVLDNAAALDAIVELQQEVERLKNRVQELEGNRD